MSNSYHGGCFSVSLPGQDTVPIPELALEAFEPVIFRQSFLMGNY